MSTTSGEWPGTDRRQDEDLRLACAVRPWLIDMVRTDTQRDLCFENVSSIVWRCRVRMALLCAFEGSDLPEVDFD